LTGISEFFMKLDIGMNLPDTREKRLAGFPPVLRQFLEAELAAGNEIVEVASCHPAPPAGAYVKLAKPVTTRAHVKTPEIDFYDRNTSIYSGEWTDAKRFFFILEPPHPPEPEPDMDAIREASNKRAVDPRALTPSYKAPANQPISQADREWRERAAVAAARKTIVQRFADSMVIDYEKWHDGIGYDLTLLKEANPKERAAIEALLLPRKTDDWRDVEALAALDTPKARQALRTAMKNGKAEIRSAVMRHAPGLVPDSQRKASLIQSLKTADFYAGLSQALDQVAEYHPPEVVRELFRGVLERKGDVAIHFAAMLMFIHGKAKTPFDWNLRPFFLQFDTVTAAEREARFRELCDKIGVNAGDYLGQR
jgi:hypothetical protein